MLTKIGNSVASRLSPTRMHWTGLKKDFSARWRHFMHGRDAGLQRAVLDDFLLVLAAWGTVISGRNILFCPNIDDLLKSH